MSELLDGPIESGRLNFVRDVVDAHARTRPERTALTHVDAYGVIERLSFAEVARRASRWANVLTEAEIGPGERALLAVEPGVDWAPLVLGALQAGIVPAPCPDTLAPSALADCVVEADTPVVVASASAGQVVEAMRGMFSSAPDIVWLEELRERLAAHPFDAPAVDAYANYLALVVFGETEDGAPRAVNHTHDYLFAHGEIATEWLDVRAGDRVWASAADGATTGPLLGLLSAWSHGAELVMAEVPLEPLERLDILSRLGIDVLCLPSSEYVRLAGLDELEALGSHGLRSAVSYGPLLPGHVRGSLLEALGLTVREGYAEPETSVLVGNTPERTRLGSLGIALGRGEVVVADPEGGEVEDGEEGVLAAASGHPTLLSAYGSGVEPPPSVVRTGRYLTAQRAFRDVDGFLWPVG